MFDQLNVGLNLGGVVRVFALISRIKFGVVKDTVGPPLVQRERNGILKQLKIWLILAFCVAGVSACQGEQGEWHQKMTVVIETPQGHRSGSGVGMVGWRNATGASEVARGGAYYRGEAVIVSLPGEGRYLFALIKGAEFIAQYTVLDQTTGRKSFTERLKGLQEIGLKGEIPPKHYPLLVTFDDITKPETVRRVDPDNLAATFGEGYALKSITLEITDEPVTQGRVEKVLGWTRGSPKIDELWSHLNHEAKEAIRGLREPRKRQP